MCFYSSLCLSNICKAIFPTSWRLFLSGPRFCYQGPCFCLSSNQRRDACTPAFSMLARRPPPVNCLHLTRAPLSFAPQPPFCPTPPWKSSVFLFLFTPCLYHLTIIRCCFYFVQKVIDSPHPHTTLSLPSGQCLFPTLP